MMVVFTSGSADVHRPSDPAAGQPRRRHRRDGRIVFSYFAERVGLQSRRCADISSGLSCSAFTSSISISIRRKKNSFPLHSFRSQRPPLSAGCWSRLKSRNSISPGTSSAFFFIPRFLRRSSRRTRKPVFRKTRLRRAPESCSRSSPLFQQSGLLCFG